MSKIDVNGHHDVPDGWTHFFARGDRPVVPNKQFRNGESFVKLPNNSTISCHKSTLMQVLWR